MHPRKDAFGLYLYGLVLNAGREKTKARSRLVESINKFPYLWPAWKALINCLPTNVESFLKGNRCLINLSPTILNDTNVFFN